MDSRGGILAASSSMSSGLGSSVNRAEIPVGPHARDFAMSSHPIAPAPASPDTSQGGQASSSSRQVDERGRGPPYNAASAAVAAEHNYAWPTSASQRSLQVGPSEVNRGVQAPSTRTQPHSSSRDIDAIPRGSVDHRGRSIPVDSRTDPSTDRSHHTGSSARTESVLHHQGHSRQQPAHAQQQREYESRLAQRTNTHGLQQSSDTRTSRHAYAPSQTGSMAPRADDLSSRPPTSSMRPPLQSRVFGLGTNLRPQTDLVDPAFFPGGVVPAEAATLSGTAESGKAQPNFSVELKASSFDHRGYPVYSGRAACIRGSIRVKKSDNAEFSIKISAHTTSGSAAAVWDGVALQPPESGAERTVFQTSEKISAADGKVEAVLPAATTPGSSSPDESEDEVVRVPFALNLPVGGSTRVVDGSLETVAVALPPSFEMSSEQDAKDKATLRNTSGAGGTSGVGGLMSGAASIKTSRTKMTAMTLRDAVESGLQQVYRVGCFYRITFNLIRGKGADRDRKASGSFFGKGRKSGGGSSANKKSKGSDLLSIPFVFLGEPTQLPPPPSSLPLIAPRILKQPSIPLAQGWESEVATAKWSGMLFKTLKRNVELELFLPAGKVIQAPSMIPILVIIRPEDPDMLPHPSAAVPLLPGTIPEQSHSHPGSPRLGAFDESDNVQSHLERANGAQAGRATRQGQDDGTDDIADDQTLRGEDEAGPASGSGGNALSRLIRTSLSISRQNTRDASSPTSVAGHTAAPSPLGTAKPLKKKTSRSTFTFNRRPNTAPSRTSSDGSPAGTEASYTVRGGGGGSSSGASGSLVDLPGLVRVSLLQNVYYSSSSVNEPPKNKRRLVSVADLEEVDLKKVCEGREPGSFLMNGGDAYAQVEQARSRGVRVLRGLLRVGREATPSFRVQGIELKYAIKVDLLPFNPRGGHKVPGSSGGPGSSSGRTNVSMSPPRTPPNRPSMHASFASGAYGHTGSAMGDSSHPGQVAQGGAAMSRIAQGQVQQSFDTTASSNWSPPARGHPQSSLAHSPSMGQDGASFVGNQSSRDLASLYHGSGAGGMSEAGWTRRSPSDQTVLGPEASKLHKSVGALWINVRLVKGRGSL